MPYLVLPVYEASSTKDEKLCASNLPLENTKTCFRPDFVFFQRPEQTIFTPEIASEVPFLKND